MKHRRECSLSRSLKFNLMTWQTDDNLIFRQGYSSTIVGWFNNARRVKMQLGQLKTWLRRSTLVEVFKTSTRLLVVVEVTSISISTIILVASIRTLLCQPALQQLGQAAGWKTS